MLEMGDAIMGTAGASGEDKAAVAAQAAISSPLLENVSIAGAKGVLINVTGGPDMTLFDVNDATSKVYDAAGADANIIVGAVIDEKLKDTIRVTVIATGFGGGMPLEKAVEEALLPLPLPQPQPQPLLRETAPDLFTTEVKPEPVAKKAPGNGGNGGRKRELVYTSDQHLDVPTYLRKQMLELEEEFSETTNLDRFTF